MKSKASRELAAPQRLGISSKKEIKGLVGLGVWQRSPTQTTYKAQGGLAAEHSLSFLGLQTIAVIPDAGKWCRNPLLCSKPTSSAIRWVLRWLIPHSIQLNPPGGQSWGAQTALAWQGALCKQECWGSASTV